MKLVVFHLLLFQFAFLIKLKPNISSQSSISNFSFRQTNLPISGSDEISSLINENDLLNELANHSFTSQLNKSQFKNMVEKIYNDAETNLSFDGSPVALFDYLHNYFSFKSSNESIVYPSLQNKGEFIDLITNTVVADIPDDSPIFLNLFKDFTSRQTPDSSLTADNSSDTQPYSSSDLPCLSESDCKTKSSIWSDKTDGRVIIRENYEMLSQVLKPLIQLTWKLCRCQEKNEKDKVTTECKNLGGAKGLVCTVPVNVLKMIFKFDEYLFKGLEKMSNTIFDPINPLK